MFDANEYKALSDDSALFNLSERQIYIIGQGIASAILSGNWENDIGDLDFDAIIGNLEYSIANEVTASGMSTLYEAQRTTAQSFSSGDNTIVFNAGDYNVSDATKLSVPTTGNYIVSGQCHTQGNGASTPFVELKIKLNGSTIIYEATGQASRIAHSGSRVMSLSSGDYLQMILRCQTNQVAIDFTELNPALGALLV